MNKMSPNVRKRTFGHVRPAKIQISLRIRAVWSVWSEFLLYMYAHLVAKGTCFRYADSED